jgi:putative zinc finger/helix-turn-helix YgiT family protein
MSRIACPNCGQEQETSLGDYRYLESGLDNVIIRGIEIFQCTCGEHSALIPNIMEIHKLIAQCLLEQTRPLAGKEIRFLRKNMSMKAVDLARLLGVDKATVSRWENDKEKHSDIVDRFIRLLYANERGMYQEADKLIKQILSVINSSHPKLPIFIMADQLGDFTCSKEYR